MPKASEYSPRDVINYRGFAATREQAYKHALAATGNHLSAERMAYGLSIPVLTPEQIKRHIPLRTKGN